MNLQLLRRLCVLTLCLFLGSNIQESVYAQNVQDEGVVPHIVRVKLKPEAESQFLALRNSKSSNGTLQMGQATLDEICVRYGVDNMKRVFPYSPKFEERHRKHGLHLWYEFTYMTDQHPDEVANTFKGYDGFEITKSVHVLSRPNEKPQLIPAKQVIERLSTNDARIGEQWHYNNTGQTGGLVGADISLFEAWESTMGSDQVVVAIMDGGIDYSHPDLTNNMWVNSGEIPGNGIDDDNNGYIDDVYGFNFVDMDGDIDPDNHGTHVAGTVSASNNNGIGVAGVAGGNEITKGARLMSCEVFSPFSNGGFAQAFVYAADNGAVIAQNSWGHTSPGVFDQEILDAIDYFIEEAGQYEGSPMQGGIVFFASGNDDSSADYYPGFYEPIVAVGATNHENQKSWYSNYGDWVDISAPGGETFISSQGVLSTLPNNSYGFYQGTSMACPHVSGIAALVLSNLSNPITNAELRELLESSVDELDNLPSAYEGKMGTGLLNAKKAVDAVPVNFQISPINTLLVVDQGESITQDITLVNDSDTTLTFTFTPSESFATLVSSISVTPNSTETVSVLIETAGVPVGNNELNIAVTVNNRSRVLSWEIDVVESPGLESNSSVAFGTVYLGYENKRYLEFVNTTYSHLVITDFISTLPDYNILSDSIVIGPNQNAFLEIQFRPESGGARNSFLTMTTNDPSNTTYSVALLGAGNDNVPPTAVVPDSVIIQQVAAGNGTTTFELLNEGDETLTYSFQLSDESQSLPLLATQFIEEDLKKGEESKIQGRPVIHGFGNDTDSDYTWIDSDESDLVIYDYIDLKNDPEATVLSGGDDVSRTFDLTNFEFPYYGNFYQRLYISTNGTINFSSSHTSFSYYEFPSLGGTSNLIGAYWKDLVMNNIYVREFDDYVVIQFDGRAYSNSSLLVDFEVIMFENGNMKFQYKTAQTSSYSVGMQNADGSKGMSIAYNTPYLKESLAIMIRKGDIIESITPETGTLAANTSQSIQVDYNSNSFYEEGETSQAYILLETNNPTQIVQEVVFELQYGGPIFDYSLSAPEFDTYVDSVYYDSLLLFNNGFLPLELSEITGSSNLTLSTTELTVAPKDTIYLAFSFTSSQKDQYDETISFTTNDPDNLTIDVDLKYNVWNAYPHLVLSHDPESISAVVVRDSVVVEQFTLTNEGEDDIEYNLSLNRVDDLSSIVFSLPKVQRPTNRKDKVISNGAIPSNFRTQNKEGVSKADISQSFEIEDGEALGFLYDYNNSWHGYASYVPESGDIPTRHIDDIPPANFRGAGEYVPTLGKYIEFTFGQQILLIDPATDEVTNVGSLPVNIDPNGAAYDYTSNEMYICSNSALYKIDLVDYSMTLIGTFNFSGSGLMISLSFDGSGNLYGVDIYSNSIYSIDPETAQIERIGYLGFETSYGSGLAWDTSNSRMVIAASNLGNTTFEFRQIDLQTGNSELLSGMPSSSGYGYQYGWIAFQNGSTQNLDITRGQLAPGESQTVNLTIDTRGLEGGDYEYRIDINSNDQLEPLKHIPTHVTIVDLIASSTLISFDSTANGDQKYEELYIVNRSSQAITLDSLVSSSPAFFVQGQTGRIQPQDSVLVRVTFQPLGDSALTYEETLDIHFEGVSNTVILSGSSYVNYLPELVEPIDSQYLTARSFKVIDLTQHFVDLNFDLITYDVEVSSAQVIEVSIENESQLVLYGKGEGQVEVTINASDILGTTVYTFYASVMGTEELPPVIMKDLSRLRVNIDQTLEYSAAQHFFDPNGDSLAYTMDASGISIFEVNMNHEGILTINPQFLGTDTLYVTATDGTSEVTLTVPVEVIPVNEAPIAAGPQRSTVYVGESFTVNLDDLFTDIDELDYTYTLDTTGVVSIYQEGNLLHVFPVDEGMANISIEAADNYSTASLEYTVEVKYPIIISEPEISISLYEGDTLHHDLVSYFNYEGNEEVQILIETSDEDNASFTFVDETKFIISGDHPGEQSYYVNFRAKDEREVMMLNVTVYEVNTAPEILEPSTTYELLVGNTWSVDLNDLFEDDSDLTFSYSSDMDAIFTNRSEDSLYVTAHTEGLSVVSITASDGELTSTVTYTFNVNHKLEIVDSIGVVTLREGEVINYDISNHYSYLGSDPVQIQFDTLDINNVELLGIEGNNLIFVGVLEDTLTYNVTLTVGDFSESFSLEIEVTEMNYTPEFHPDSSNVMLTVGDYQVVNLQDYFIDANEDSLTFSLGEYSGEFVRVNLNDGENLELFALADGTTTLPITVSDGFVEVLIDFEVVVTSPIVVSESEISITLYEGDTLREDLSSYFTYEGSEEVQITVETSEEDNATLTFEDETTLVVSGNQIGEQTYNVNLRVGGENEVIMLTVIVNEANTAPEILVPSTTYGLLVGNTWSVDMNDLFEDDSELTYTFSSDMDVIVANRSEDSLFVTAHTEGTTVVSITANDGDLTSTVSYTFNVNHNLEIVNSNAIVTLREGDMVYYDISNHYTYLGSDPVQIQFDSLDINNVELLGIEGNILSFKGVLEGTQTYNVTLTVGEFSETFSLEFEVTETNYAPEIHPDSSNVTLTVGDYQVVNLQDYFIDANEDSLTFTLGEYSDGFVSANLSNGQNLVLFAMAEGTTTLPITVSDGSVEVLIDLEIVVKAAIVNAIIDEASNGINIYPNPASTSTTVTFDVSKPTTLSLDILDFSGRKLESTEWEKVPQGTFKETIDVSNLVVGTYILCFTTEDGQTLYKRLIIK